MKFGYLRRNFGQMNTVPKLPQALVPARRICELLHAKAKIEPDPREPATGLMPGAYQGSIQFNSVNFWYPAEPTKQVLDGLSFAVEPGQKVAFVGETGCGKSAQHRQHFPGSNAQSRD